MADIVKKSEYVPANELKSLPNSFDIRDWNIRRGGLSHDAATVVASREKEYKTTKDAIQAVIEHTDTLVKAAEEREVKFRKGEK